MNPTIIAFVDSLSRTQQDRVLGAKLAPGHFRRQDDGRCLVGAAFDCTAEELGFLFRSAWYRVRYGFNLWDVARHFDSACHYNRGNVAGVGATIRQHILERRARKLLGPRCHPEPPPRNLTETHVYAS